MKDKEKNKITKKGERKNLQVNNYEILYEQHEILDRGSKHYLLYATWYDEEKNMYYFYSTQSRYDIVHDRFTSFMHSFRTI